MRSSQTSSSRPDDVALLAEMLEVLVLALSVMEEEAAAFGASHLPLFSWRMTLSFSQVSCERAFSKLKLAKTRLRSSLSNEKLEAEEEQQEQEQ